MVKFKPVKDLDSFEMNPKHMLQGNMIELLVDTKKKKIFHVEPPMDHAIAAAMYLGFNKDEAHRVTKKNGSHLVSAFVQIEGGVVTMILIGRSSLEMYFHNKHKPERLHDSGDLKAARKLVDEMVRLSKQLGEVQIINHLEDHEMVFK